MVCGIEAAFPGKQREVLYEDISKSIVRGMGSEDGSITRLLRLNFYVKNSYI